MNPLLKLALEAGPLMVFFLINAKADLFWATGAFMVAIVASLLASYALERRIPVLPLVSGVFVLGFGGLTLILQDELFIKLKPTIVNVLFAIILLGGLAFNRPLLQPLLGAMINLDPPGWRRITFRWALFFLMLATLNEVAWRNLDTDTWVGFKVFGIMPLTLAFSLAQIPLIQRHRIPEAGEQET